MSANRRSGNKFGKISIGLTITVLTLTALVYLHLPQTEAPKPTGRTLDDASNLNSTPIDTLIRVTSKSDVSNALAYAKDHNLIVSIAGKRHSMGGQSLVKNGVVLDMTGYNQVLGLDSARRIVTVQSGVTWSDLQEYLNEKKLAVVAMQGPNIFTVGGSISVNAHGWDLKSEQVGMTVAAFRLMCADGSIQECSKTQNDELFHLVIGGYGLFGVILDADLYVTDNIILTPHRTIIPYTAFPALMASIVADTGRTRLFHADMSIAGSSFLVQMNVFEFREPQNASPVSTPIKQESNVVRDRFFINLSRKYDWGKELRWWLQKRFVSLDEDSRNNLMRTPFQRLLYFSKQDTDILQEYFIPQDKFVSFADKLREIVETEHANLLNCTIRYVNASTAAYLNYAKSNSLAFVLYFNVPKSSEGMEANARLTRKLIDAALHEGGTFYLPYLLNYSESDLRSAYPETGDFFAQKRKYDPEIRFQNKFYTTFGNLLVEAQDSGK